MLFYSHKAYYIVKIRYFSLIFLFLLSIAAFAQKEASIWSIGNGQQFNFQSGNFELTSFPANEAANSTICDKEGNLVLYSDGRKVWNKNNEVLINGEELINQNLNIVNLPVFIPYPGKEGWYILLYEEIDYTSPSTGIIDNALYYAEINTQANNGRGELVKQKVKIHDNYHSGPTVAGFCNNSYYWLAINRNENITSVNRDRIYFYKIDKNGISLTPVINDKIDIGNSGSYKFSPDGDKLSFSVGGNSVDSDIIADFNFNTGELYNYRYLHSDTFTKKEFSPDSRFVYYFSGANLIQCDVRYTDAALIQNTAVTILRLASNDNNKYPGGEMEVAPDGKIYFYYYDIVDNQRKLGRINNPNGKGNACNAELDFSIIKSDYPFMPEFVTSFLREKLPVNIDEIYPDAGPELIVCSGSSATVGINDSSRAYYSWSPEASLADPFSAQTIFSPHSNSSSPYTLTLILKATDGNCWVHFDQTSVIVNPRPWKLPVDGSWSVCPFVKEVDYWTVDDQNMLQWLVDGGDIVPNTNNDSIKINWGETNPGASVSVFSTNRYKCSSDTSVFPVRINVELVTETPKGPDKICIARGKNIPYEIRKTNGSVYNWNPIGGNVVSGQGTNQVLVTWQTTGINKIVVDETSTTIDTICFGESIPLLVEVINDSLEIALTNVTFTNDNSIEITYNSDKLNKNHLLFQVVKNADGIVESEFPITGNFNGVHIYHPDTSDLSPETILLKVINACNETFYSNPEETIILAGEENIYQNTIELTWNVNQFWKPNQLKHEIWHSKSGLDGWKLVKTIGDETEFSFPIQDVSLYHYFKIKEINTDKNLESWSNVSKIEVEDKIVIPDVFTPNSDGFNDVWKIGKIDFHSLKSVIIYNKTGEVVYECKNVYLPWDGKVNNKISQGTYFYQITFDSENIRYGQVTILQ